MTKKIFLSIFIINYNGKPSQSVQDTIDETYSNVLDFIKNNYPIGIIGLCFFFIYKIISWMINCLFIFIVNQFKIEIKKPIGIQQLDKQLLVSHISKQINPLGDNNS
jgi:hypothetical protein